MTAPTPQEVIHDLHVGFPETRRSALIQEAIDTLAAVTAERDQARSERDAWLRQLEEQATSTREEIERADRAESIIATLESFRLIDETPIEALERIGALLDEN